MVEIVKQRTGNKKKQYLERVKLYEHRIDSLQRHLKAEEHRKTQVKAIDYSKEQVKGGNQSSWEALIDKTDKYKQDIIETSVKLVELRTEILEIINKVEDQRYALLLTLRYVECLDWTDIEKIFDRTRNTIDQWHTNALAEIWIPNL